MTTLFYKTRYNALKQKIKSLANMDRTMEVKEEIKKTQNEMYRIYREYHLSNS